MLVSFFISLDRHEVRYWCRIMFIFFILMLFFYLNLNNNDSVVKIL
jgi:hypothetical protein